MSINFTSDFLKKYNSLLFCNSETIITITCVTFVKGGYGSESTLSIHPSVHLFKTLLGCLVCVIYNISHSSIFKLCIMIVLIGKILKKYFFFYYC